MHILLIFGEGRMEDALLLGSTPERMRVMLRGRADAMEFRRYEGVWMTESGASVEIAAVSPVTPTGNVVAEFDRAAARLREQLAMDRLGHLRAN